MAEESVNSPVTPEENEANSVNMGKRSAVNSDSLEYGLAAPAKDGGASVDLCRTVRNSTENPQSASSCVNTIPHYLRASTGSCHDLCKYGKKNAVEEKVRAPLRSRVAKTSLAERSSLGVLVSGAENKEVVARHMHSTEINKHLSGLKTSPDSQKVYSSRSQLSLSTRTILPCQNISSGSKINLPKHKPFPSKKKILSPEPPEIIKREIVFPSKEVEAHLEQGSSVDGEALRTDKLSEKISEMHLKSVNIDLLSSSDTHDNIHGKVRRNCEATADRRKPGSKASVQKAMASSTAPLSSKISQGKTIVNRERKARNTQLVSPQKDQTRIMRTKTKSSNNKKVYDRTFYSIKTVSDDNSIKFASDGHGIRSLLPPKSPSNAKSQSMLTHKQDADGKTDGSASEIQVLVPNNKLVKIGKIHSETQNPDKNLKKSRVVASDNKIRSPAKLKFRSGKVVANFQSETNSPRRLKFRRARVLGATESKGEMRKVLKNAGSKSVITAGNPSSSVKVVLKHHGVQQKKGAQGLLNNVIKETASKLVQSRKSKVKALVGAFETVISLQDRKPSSQPV